MNRVILVIFFFSMAILSSLYGHLAYGLKPNDLLYVDQWGLEKIEAPETWDIRTDASNIVVAVIDTGVDYNHPDLAANMWTDIDGSHGYDFIDNDNDPMDKEGHGTYVAGVIGAVGNNGIGITGLAWNVKIMAIRASNAEQLKQAYDYIIRKKEEGVNIRVVNQSTGLNINFIQYNQRNQPEDRIGKKKFRELINHGIHGILFITASGNGGKLIDCSPPTISPFTDGTFIIPTCYSSEEPNKDTPNLLSVAATRQDENLTENPPSKDEGGSNYGPVYIHLGAPGKEICTTKIGGDYTCDLNATPKTSGISGTSFSAPLVAGAAALLMAQFPNESAAQISKRIMDNVQIHPNLIGKIKSGGRLNLYKALGLNILKVNKDGSGIGTVYSNKINAPEPNSILCGDICSAIFPNYASVTLVAQPDPGFTFQGWSSCSNITGGECTISMWGFAAEVTATFILSRLPFAVNKAGTGSGTVISSPAGINCGSDCTENYAASTQLTLTPTPDSGSLFTGWSGDCTGAGSCTVSMDTMRSITATFSLPSLVINKAGLGSGTVTSNPAGINCGSDCQEDYGAGTSITLTATPVAGSTFSGWSDGCTGAASVCTTTLANSKNVTATFNGNSSKTLNVTNLQNSGLGSLRQAIDHANASPGKDTINIGLSGTISASNLNITDDLVINGPGANQLTISGNKTGDIFNVYNNTAVAINGLTIRDGYNTSDYFGGGISNGGMLTLNDCILLDNFSYKGGGINNQGSLTINNSTLSNNYARDGGAIYGGNINIFKSVLTSNSANYSGGGIISYGNLSIRESVISENTSASGGGIYFSNVYDDGLLSIDNSTISNNTGGGISINGESRITNSTISNNQSDGYGGGIDMGNGTLTIHDSILSGNIASGAGGGIYNYGRLEIINSTLFNNSLNCAGAGFGVGGGINSSGFTIIANSTLSANTVRCTNNSEGGGIFNDEGKLIIINSTIAGNSAILGGGLYSHGILILGNSLVIGNTASTGKEIYIEAYYLAGYPFYDGELANFISKGHNLLGENGVSGLSGVLPTTGDLILAGTANTAISPLADNGGPTPTHALVTGSPAINAGRNELLLAGMTTDQRGQSRIQNSVVDIGAVESEPSVSPISYALSVTKIGAGSGTVASIPAGVTCGSACFANFANGTAITLYAAPDKYFTFAGWSGACAGTGSCTVAMNAAKTVTATFDTSAPDTYTLTVGKTGTGSGTITGSGINCGSDCMERHTSGASVTLTATAASGSTFVGWSGANCSGVSDCTVTMTAAQSVTATFTATTPLIFSGDFNGDGRSDLIWHHGATGQVYGMLLNGFGISQQGLFYHEPNTAWRIVGNGDLTGDGKSDLLWRNSSTGQVYEMWMNGLDIAGGAVIYQESNTAWQIIAVGDLNGDGKVDLIWWNNQTGQVYGMLMNGPALLQAGMIYQEVNIAWIILAARDFTGDGQADLLWRNTNTGQVYLLPMNGLTTAGGAMIYQEPNLAWSIVAVGDLNGDGKADLIWWNSSTGQVYGMLMNGALIAAQGLIYQEANTAWNIIASGDYTGDGKADLLWRNKATGQIYEMPLNGLSIAGGAQIHQESNTDWRIVAAANANTPRLPAKALAGAPRFAPLSGEPLNPVTPLDGEPVNPHQPMDGEPINFR